MSPQQLQQLERIDHHVGRLLAALPAHARVLLQSDHGGHERTHGTDMPEDMTIPWIIAGPGIRQGHTIQAPVSLLDTAPTIAHLLGAAPPVEWEGRAVLEILEN
jgi:arylsulfatase A-like enzyme